MLKSVTMDTKNDSKIRIIDCGLQDYQSTLEQQSRLNAQVIAKEIPGTILLVEHPAVITFGLRNRENKLLKSADSISKNGIDIVRIRRGGGTTAHNPGQLVVYPIINLKKHSLGINEFVRLLERIGTELLFQIGVKCETKKGYPGLWVGQKKIASIGVQIKKWTTIHGIAININNDLSIFDYIVPCGIENIEMTSVQKELGPTVEVSNAKKILKTILLKAFELKNERQ